MSFEKYNFEVFTAQDKSDALNRYSEHAPFDFVLFDMFLPNCKAYELVDELKRLYHFSEPFIFVSGEPSLDVVLEAIRSGPSEYIMKPISNRDLIQRIFKILEEKEKENDKFSIMSSTIEKIRVLESKYEKSFEVYIDYFSNQGVSNSKSLDDEFQKNLKELLEFLTNFGDCLEKLK